MKQTNSFAAVSRFGWLRAATLFAFVLLAGSLTASAQVVSGNQRIVHKVVKQHTNPPELGRDFWFSPIQNYQDEGGKYYRLYITSPNNTTAFVESQGIVKAVPVNSYGVGTFNMPLDWEMKSSGYVEDKAVHVYDPTDDICVYLMSHNPYTSDGARLIPTTGWGTDYVVAGYEALYEGGSGAYGYDFPSEFTISADQDNTICEITPSQDFRLATIWPNGATNVGFHKGQKFEIQLNRGQCIQFQTTDASDADNFDVTGTIVHANVGVDIMAGSACPNIPPDFPYCDQVCDQVPPTRVWAETYYTTNPAQTQPGHDYSLYCLISTKPNQTIHRYDNTTGDHVECTLGPTYDHLFVEEELSNKWYSDAPFLLVQYLNSATYPDGANGSGDPAECCVTPAENFTQTVVFEAPVSVGAQAPYVNYANVIVPVADEFKNVAKGLHGVLFNGKGISSFARQPIDDTFDMILIPHVAAGAQLLQADSGFTVGVYVYGYGYDESYMWSGGFGNGTFHSPDTVPPADVITGECFSANIHLTDSGYLPGITPLTLQSGLNEIRLDTDINMAYQPDLYPAWVDGGNFDTSGYSMYVVDETKPAKLVVDIFDNAGNETTITSTYVPQTAMISPPLQDFGVIAPGQYDTLYDTITNLGAVPFKFTQLSLKYGNRGFTILGPSTPDSIPVGKQLPVEIQFSPIQLTAAVDSVIFGDPCVTQVVAVIGSGGAPDFYVTDVTWKDVPLTPLPPGNWVIKGAAIHNLSKLESIQVSPAGWIPGGSGVAGGQNTLFVPVPVALLPAWAPAGSNVFPVTVPPLTAQFGSGIDTVYYYFEPVDLNRDIAQELWSSPQVDSLDGAQAYRSDKFIGNAVTPTLTFQSSIDTTLDCLDPSVTSVVLGFTLSNTGTQGAVINGVSVTDPKDFTGLVGHDQHGKTWDPTKLPQNLPAGAQDTFYVTVPVNALTNSKFSTLIIADLVGQSPDTLTATVTVEYRAYTLSPPNGITFNPANYQGLPPPQQTFTITNTSSSDLVIYNIAFEQGGTYNQAFSLQQLTFPDTIPAGHTLDVNVTFNPSFSSDSSQTTKIQMTTNACSDADIACAASVLVWGASMTTFVPTPILACDSRVDPILIKDFQASDEAENAFDTVISATWLQGGTNFSISSIVGQMINGGGGSITVPVTFTPNQAPQTNQVYYDTLQVTLYRVRGGDTTINDPISGIASSFSIAAMSVFGNTGSALPGNTVSMPITVALDKNGLNSDSLQEMNINKIILTYNVQNPSLVTPKQMINVPTGQGWSALPPAWDPNTGTLIDTLTGTTPLGDWVSNTGLGTMPFTVYLDKADNTSNVTLTSMQLIKSDGTTLGPCLGVSTQSGAMSLILQCPDSTLRLLMSGNGNLINFVNPASPDPVSGGHVTFSYANRGATDITLSIIDVLGHEVLRPIDNVYHDAGAWQTTTDVSKLPSGTYTYRLSAQGYVVSRQFVIDR